MTEQNHPQDTSIPTLLATPRRPALLAGHDNTLEVLVRSRRPTRRPNCRSVIRSTCRS